MSQEIFKKIDGFVNYSVSNIGRIRNDKTQRILKCVNNRGYHTISLRSNNKTYIRYVHRLVASAFIKKNSEQLIVNHKNGIKDDNRVDNLEFCTYQQNYDHACTEIEGCNINKRRMLIAISTTDNKVKIFESLNSAKKAGFNIGHVWSCANGKRKQHKGYRWGYV